MEDTLTPMTTMLDVPVSQPRTMSFLDAMAEIIKGKKVARVDWGNDDFCLMKDGWLEIFRDGQYYAWKIKDGDVEGNDWVVVMKNG